MSSELEALAALGLPEHIASGARRALGPDAASRVAADPWSLLAVDGVRPEQVDGYARGRLGASARPEDPRRQVALLTWLVRRAARDGHTVVPMAIIGLALAAYGIEKSDTAVIETTDRGVLVELASGIALQECAQAERRIAECIRSLVGSRGADDWIDGTLDGGLAVLSGPSGDPLDRAVGGLVARARERGIPVSLLASTAGSAARLSAAHDMPATVDLASVAEQPGLLIATDAQAHDVVPMAALLTSRSNAQPIALVGDPHALPPLAGPGQPFADIATSGLAAVHDVEPTSRESGPVATIAELAAAIAQGMLPRIEAPDKQVVLVPAGGAKDAMRRVHQLVTDAILRTFGLAPSDVMVLGPAVRGEAGVDALNNAIKAAVNAGGGVLGGFDVGDRVLLTRRLDDGVVRPGDCGLIIGQIGEAVQVEIAGQVVTVPPPLTDWLRPAWALTVARAAVGRWPACVLVLPGESAGLLSRALLRTAVTCAERHLSIVHSAGPAVAHAVVRATPRRRRTALPTLLGAGTAAS